MTVTSAAFKGLDFGLGLRSSALAIVELLYLVEPVDLCPRDGLRRRLPPESEARGSHRGGEADTVGAPQSGAAGSLRGGEADTKGPALLVRREVRWSPGRCPSRRSCPRTVRPRD